MKKIIAASLVLALLTSPIAAHAFFYEAKCLVPTGKFKKCHLDFSKKDSFKITYNDFEYSSLNRVITGKSVQHIAMGEKAQRRWATFGVATWALGPLGALFILWKKKSAIFSLEYRQGKEGEAVMFGVKKKLGPQIMNELHNLSGKKVDGFIAGQ